MEESQVTDEEQEYIEALVKRAGKAKISLRGVLTEQKNKALLDLAQRLDEKRGEIQEENKIDLANGKSANLSESMINRLELSDKTIDSMIESLREIAALKDPVGEIADGWTLPNGLRLEKRRVPIGVVAIIYESRPNVTVDVGALGLKSSNAVILRGGKEAIHSNRILGRLFQESLKAHGISGDAVQLVERTERKLMEPLLRMDKDIDLVVPRGGEGLIRYVSENSLVPVVKHDKGVCHIYIHSSADCKMAIDITLNAKTQRPGVCNAAETLILDKDAACGREALSSLIEAGVKLRGDEKTRAAFSGLEMDELSDEGYDCEYLALEMSVKVVEGLDEAIGHIQRYTSEHSEAIIAKDYDAIQKFTSELDSAALFVNASTRFHDGGQFGLGAEVGISTGKLHCRGPMGLTDLTTTKYVVSGHGQVRG